MGAKITFELREDKYEPLGDIVVQNAELNGVEVKDRISWLIDEVPALAIAFACANGKSYVRNAKELRVKESDRITAVVKNLQEFGIIVEEFEDGFCVTGGTPQSGTATSFGDHRIAMSFSILGLVCGSVVKDCAGVATSFPNFFEILSKITTIQTINAS
jgi:3-phosphoshikimate 1-carboxyvinyltransferase